MLPLLANLVKLFFISTQYFSIYYIKKIKINKNSKALKFRLKNKHQIIYQIISNKNDFTLFYYQLAKRRIIHLNYCKIFFIIQ